MKNRTEIIKRGRGRPRLHPLPQPVPEIKRTRGRPRKNPLPAPIVVPSEIHPKTVRKARKRAKDEYTLVSIDDIEWWAKTARHADKFIQASVEYNKLRRSKIPAEIRWYKDRIEVISIS